MRIGIFGGTFDPVHTGHLILAEQCRDQAALDQVWFLPSYHPPHKATATITRFEQRCDMLELAIAGHPAFRVHRIEKELPPPSYTAETLIELRRLHPEHDFFLLTGADQVADMPTWYRPEKVIELVELLVVPRPGVTLWTAEQLAQSLGVEPPQVRMQIVSCPLMEIASRDLRKAIAEGRSVRYLMPRSAEEYIRERKLYSKP